ncbi:beta-glucuronidase [Puniceicoccales bacterium CK1056]|uniref:Beta-glucuronidase n=1 Tax=Oceanipulchritudo coccoides TaxID=2706888 RepID=A0A6B2M0T5_9BACT|nr:glycoside hydrolase family 2 TIM barrel-domain containing protein [Oceanipulchritudo coccoides]NDV61647.1 beta-glucuronidase [Oceanipulchritudo coccoides]
MKSCNLLLLTLLTLLGSVSMQAEALITNVDHRETTSLAGKWRVIVDPFETGFYSYRYEEIKNRDNGFSMDAKAADKSALLEYNFDSSGTLDVPGDWNSQREKLFFYEGTVWYRKKFDYHLQPGKRLFAYFGAINYEAIVYLNGQKVGTHTGGFTPFNFELTNYLKAGENSLVIKADNKRRSTAIPTVMSDWWNYGGLTRRVLLIEESNTFIRDYHIQLAKDSMETIAGWVQLDGAEGAQPVTVRIPEAGITQTVQTDERGYAEISFDADLSLWSPDNPKLYRVEISAGEELLEDEIGFRSVQVRGNDILLNGKAIFLRGICIHEESPLRPGRAYTPEDARILLEWSKELNCNFVRLAHYPHNEYMTRQADRMGILVWSEIPLYWTISWDNPEVYSNAVQQLTEMITRDKNKASVILWSVANETPVSEQRTKFLADLTKVARSLDPTRLITAALEAEWPKEGIAINDPLGAYLDVLGCNEYLGWYGSTDPRNFDKTWFTKYEKPLIISEFGAGALQGYHADPDTRWSEEFQAQVYERQIPMLDRIPFLRGTSPWILKDFKSPRRPLPYFQDYFNRKGLISDTGERKQAFYILQDYYRQIESGEGDSAR